MQRFPFADNTYYEVKNDDVPCRKNKVVPYDELYTLKGVPFHSLESVKHYVDRKRKIEKLDKEHEKHRVCEERYSNKLNGKRRMVKYIGIMVNIIGNDNNKKYYFNK